MSEIKTYNWLTLCNSPPDNLTPRSPTFDWYLLGKERIFSWIAAAWQASNTTRKRFSCGLKSSGIQIKHTFICSIQIGISQIVQDCIIEQSRILYLISLFDGFERFWLTWGTTPIFSLKLFSVTSRISCPSTLMLPFSTSKNLNSSFNRVVLPQPCSPTIAIVEPGGALKVISRIMGLWSSYWKDTFLKFISPWLITKSWAAELSWMRGFVCRSSSKRSALIILVCNWRRKFPRKLKGAIDQISL